MENLLKQKEVLLKELANARRNNEYLLQLRLLQSIDIIDCRLKYERVTWREAMKRAGAKGDDVVKINNLIAELMFFCDAIDYVATDIKSLYHQATKDAALFNLSEAVRRIHEQAIEIRKNADDDDNSNFADMCDDIFPLVVNKIKKHLRKDNEEILKEFGK